MKFIFNLKKRKKETFNGVVSSEFVDFTKGQFDKLMKKNIKIPISMISL